ncbi:DUF2849 domain-containing protein [Roseitranquillus sediminis]|uniref:DUF2849 domain-containing protein n=1 Tax=Roseitranquillus sediminis TaxID=2809051 RepID=UPI001D0C5995|nr:DUF2849 domain-containing protein [Roseitranquillus sediminis]MBM9594183.1 DUF2849 domain-containing protein [Roseitranquillus sediminis]
MAKKFKTSIVTANDLLTGDVVYLTAAGDWSLRHGDAELLTEEAQAQTLLRAAEEQYDQVVGPYLAEAEPGPDGARPIHFREAFRARGPSNYPHGKQAQG